MTRREKRVIQYKGGLMKVKIDYYERQIKEEQQEIQVKQKLIGQYQAELKRIRTARRIYNLMKEPSSSANRSNKEVK